LGRPSSCASGIISASTTSNLVAFGIKPFRGRKRAKKKAVAETPTPEAADPSEP